MLLPPWEQLEGRGILSARVLQAVRSVPREQFLPEEVRHLAWEDRAVGIGYGATISQPYIVAAMTELLEPEPHHRVLEIGTGSGYQAAVLSGLVSEVWSVELIPELARSAAALLARLGLGNVRVRQGDGYLGWPEQAPFDRVILTAAPPEVPSALLEQMAPGGRLVAPVGSDPQQQSLRVWDRLPEGNAWRERAVFDVSFVPMTPGDCERRRGPGCTT